jgi:hypothetical protein
MGFFGWFIVLIIATLVAGPIGLLLVAGAGILALLAGK